MNEEKRFVSFYDDCKEQLEEHLDRVRIYLQNNNDEYRKLQIEIEDVLNSSENLQRIACDDKIISELSIEESKLLSKVIILYINMQYIVEREMYFKGGTDAYDYFKKINIIK